MNKNTQIALKILSLLEALLFTKMSKRDSDLKKSELWSYSQLYDVDGVPEEIRTKLRNLLTLHFQSGSSK